MAADRDARTKISIEADAVLDAVAKSRGCDRADVLRDVIQRWADEHLHIASLIDLRLRAEGRKGVSEGDAGDPGARDGMRGSIGRR